MGDMHAESPARAGTGFVPASDDWLRLLLDDGPPDIATLWEVCIGFEYDRSELVAGLSWWLGAPRNMRVLDCACGTGFPALDLLRAGYDVTCSDGSPLMLGYFKQRADLDGVAAQAAQVRWENLTDNFEPAYDVVMCRGCALPYAGTWDDDAEPDREALIASIRQFTACLRAGGRLYVDTAQALRPDAPVPQRIAHPELAIGPHRVKLEEVLTVDPGRRLRLWLSRLTIDGQTYEFERRSHYLPPAELVGLLTDAGLSDVRRAAVPGERYAVVTARRTRG